MSADLAPSLRRVRDGGLCAGCGACAALAPARITMTLDAAGRLRPRQSGAVDAATDAAIAAVCPGLGLTQDAAGRTDDPLWGPLVAARTGWATDPALRRQGSSGGALSAILIHLLATGAVDRVIQTAAAPMPPIGNVTVLAADPAAVFSAAGSRYAPSAPLADLPAALALPGRAAFVGKPCDVAALRAMARGDRAIAEAIPVALSFFCAGVPGLAGAREVLARLGVAEAELAAFRYRGDGWPGRATAVRRDGSVASMSYAESWGGILSRHVQFRCKICPDGVGGFADIVCADAWSSDSRGYPVFEEADGVSLIMTRTALGERILTAAMACGDIEATPFALGPLAAMQPGQSRRKRALLARLAALRLSGRPTPRFAGFNLWRAARGAGLVSHLREFLGLFRRIALGRVD